LNEAIGTFDTARLNTVALQVRPFFSRNGFTREVDHTIRTIQSGPPFSQ
jgi:hypothetical protein